MSDMKFVDRHQPQKEKYTETLRANVECAIQNEICVNVNGTAPKRLLVRITFLKVTIYDSLFHE